ncbi:MAG: hypothetical protein JWO13_3418 [Acidobacteriales bacterium]|nr:hypothetical protein [Terriglobales bacterium]
MAQAPEARKGIAHPMSGHVRAGCIEDFFVDIRTTLL